jgi:HK97 family phage prohead protease
MIIDPSGIDTGIYNGIVLFNHDVTEPIGRCIPQMDGAVLAGRIDFAPAGVSSTADRVCGLVKSGVLSGISIGFNPDTVSPSRDRNGYYRVSRAVLLEVSVVSVGADPGAMITARGSRDYWSDYELITWGHELLRNERLRKPVWDRSVDIGWFGREAARRAHKKFLAVYGL